MDNTEYLTKQITIYMGNKRKLIGRICEAVEIAKSELGVDRCTTFDAFSGSGIVSRALRAHSDKVIANDLENYSHVINQCYLVNRSDIDLDQIQKHVDQINMLRLTSNLGQGFIERLYAPRDTFNPQPGERCFYTTRNAKILDNIRRLVEERVAPENRPFLLGPLLPQVVRAANSPGHFQGYYRDKQTGAGIFGGKDKGLQKAVFTDIQLEMPVTSDIDCEFELYQEDYFKLAPVLDNIDVAYLDPPYSSNIYYGSSYFMLNLVTTYKEPEKVSKVGGIPKDWNRSPFYKSLEAIRVFEEMVDAVKAKAVVISYSNEGAVDHATIMDILKARGSVLVDEIDHPAFNGGLRKNTKDSTRVKERIYTLFKS